VHTAVISHLHQDHIGGLRELTHANLIISDTEWKTLAQPLPEPRGLLLSHIDLPGLTWQRIDPAPGTGHDLFGDGSMVLLPTPGHTPGSISMLVRRSGQPPLLMVGDVTYDAHLFDQGHLPGLGNKRQLRNTNRLIQDFAQQHPGLVILPAHDPGAAARLHAATNGSAQAAR
jgi:N-acyl homoserine lactone hydrolase